MTDDLCSLSAEELIGRYRSRELSPVEQMRATLSRIDTVNASVNALSFIDAERALVAARASEERWRRGEPAGALDGVPTTLKDRIPAEGTLTFFGSNAFNTERIPDATDAPLSARLKEAGAIIVAKTTQPDLAMIASGISSRHGVTRNPWDLSRNTGGSSSGAAAAVAAGFGPLAIGTDGGGSIRIPAAFCGVFGLKPSYGRVPFHDPALWSVAGPMTRSVRDAALMMNVITQPDARDFSSLPYDARDYCAGLDSGVRGARIGLLEDIGFGLKTDPQIRGMLLRAARVFEELGAVVEPIRPLFTESPEPDFERLFHLRNYLRFSRMTQAQRDAMLPVLSEWCGRGHAEPKELLMQSLDNVGPIRRAALAPFVAHEFVLSPVMAVLPYAADLPWPPGGTAHNPFCFPFSMSEQPAASIPGGFSSEGLPMGLQIVGRRFDDWGVLRAAYAYEQASGFLSRRPPL
jgi:aspartyl-tRNA(Asn)/glutamyl-tRNA(Gln) amidotransferase subunit A